eukprot:TRINITY_DN15952_c0_g2_i1.p1 TRINITY_DN15952_c0_g2~~TRINITY_DN15952_c0_g2_i1.p1  ORF type:complete len:425 (+),score=76.45 TRINITY_DN15952_c0_g2_i1:83-1357(+)
MFGPRWNEAKCKTNIKLAVNRLKLQQNKKANLIKARKKEIAQLLAEGKDESARIKVEFIIREDNLSAACELLTQYCELLLARIKFISETKEPPVDLVETISSVMYASRISEVPELREVFKLLTAKYGKEFAQAATANLDGCVNPRLVHRLSVQPPDSSLVLTYLIEIARCHDVQWEPPESTPTSMSSFSSAPPSTVGTGSSGSPSVVGPPSMVSGYSAHNPAQVAAPPPAGFATVGGPPPAGYEQGFQHGYQQGLQQGGPPVPLGPGPPMMAGPPPVMVGQPNPYNGGPPPSAGPGMGGFPPPPPPSGQAGVPNAPPTYNELFGVEGGPVGHPVPHQPFAPPPPPPVVAAAPPPPPPAADAGLPPPPPPPGGLPASPKPHPADPALMGMPNVPAGNGGAAPGPGGEVPDFDELAARFEALKKRG